MEDALISPAGFMILSGAGLIEASTSAPIRVHTTEPVQATVTSDDDGQVTGVTIMLSETPYQKTGSSENFIYVMLLNDGEVVSEPYIPTVDGKKLTLKTTDDLTAFDPTKDNIVLVDYYVERKSGAQEITITPDKFGGNYYLEASTLFRSTNGVDMPAEFIIPNCKIQSNFTFTMASSGDPSTFTFTMDAFPDYTRFDGTKKVLAAIQIVSDEIGDTASWRSETKSLDSVNADGTVNADSANKTSEEEGGSDTTPENGTTTPENGTDAQG
jgi:hypothetical protein